VRNGIVKSLLPLRNEENEDSMLLNALMVYLYIHILRAERIPVDRISGFSHEMPVLPQQKLSQKSLSVMI